jgi:hypothetical protein
MTTTTTTTTGTYMSSSGNIILQNDNSKDQLDWNADYDGNIANIKLNVTEDDERNKQKINQLNMKLTNNDLANLLSIPSIAGPIDQRLQNDFMNAPFMQRHSSRHSPYLLALSKPLPPKNTSVPLLLLEEQNEMDKGAVTLSKKLYNNKTPSPKTLHIHLPKSTEQRQGLGQGQKKTRHRKRTKKHHSKNSKTKRHHKKSLSNFISQFVTNG